MTEVMMFGDQGVVPCEQCPEKDSYTGLPCRQIVGDNCPKYAIGESYNGNSHGLTVSVRDEYEEPTEKPKNSPAPNVRIPLNAEVVLTKYV